MESVDKLNNISDYFDEAGLEKENIQKLHSSMPIYALISEVILAMINKDILIFVPSNNGNLEYDLYDYLGETIIIQKDLKSLGLLSEGEIYDLLESNIAKYDENNQESKYMILLLPKSSKEEKAEVFIYQKCFNLKKNTQTSASNLISCFQKQI